MGGRTRWYVSGRHMTRASTADNTTARLVPLFRFTPVCAGVPPPAVRGLHEATGVAVYVNESNSTAAYMRCARYLRGSIYVARSNISHPREAPLALVYAMSRARLPARPTLPELQRILRAARL